jgi:hypothetical protein
MCRRLSLNHAAVVAVSVVGNRARVAPVRPRNGANAKPIATGKTPWVRGTPRLPYGGARRSRTLQLPKLRCIARHLSRVPP